ncbi:Elongation factor 1-alpha [Carex littledalei]|uniref:Elongation factor 1-alpha n=1 Tax=Carex littledalei TaxID=544730 RepID=A0A833RHB3_9POAL|nr:Elongation factor 1-alpha [Carex littledalei]
MVGECALDLAPSTANLTTKYSANIQLMAGLVFKRKSDKPLQHLILDVYKIGGIDIVSVGRVETEVLKRDMAVSFSPSGVGRVETGVLKRDMAVSFIPSGLTVDVGSIEKNHESIQEAVPLYLVTLLDSV